MPRAAFLRAIKLKHWYHHRGQLLVYLRLLDVPLPSVYGPTADDDPFRWATFGCAPDQQVEPAVHESERLGMLYSCERI